MISPVPGSAALRAVSDSPQNSRASCDSAQPLPKVAGALLASKLRTVEQMWASAAKDGEPRVIHQLRVATRRAWAVLALVKPYCKKSTWRKTRNALREIRGIATEARRCHVQSKMIQDRLRTADEPLESVLSALDRAIHQREKQATHQIADEWQGKTPKSLKTLRRRLLQEIAESDTTITFGEALQRTIAQRVQAMCEAARADLSDVQNVHQVRLAGKKVRYLLEILPSEESNDAPASLNLHKELEDLQDRLGAINDMAELAARLQELLAQPSNEAAGHNSREAGLDAPESQAALILLFDEFRREQTHLHHSFLHWWNSDAADALRQALDQAATAADQSPEKTLTADVANGTTTSAAIETLASSSAGPDDSSGAISESDVWPKRLAAIDVGTNSIRLVIAEVFADGRQRILDDERAVTRLGRGLARTGRLSERAMKESASALSHFRAIAEGYRAANLKAVATCAVREAKNGRKFIDLVKRIASLDLEIISAQTEARLAFRSVSKSFDLRGLRTIVIDIGGGSTEIIFGSGDLIEQVYSLPVGAVRLTEKFRIGSDVSVADYRRMRQYISRMIKETVGRPLFVPHLTVGTGGTFTTLADISMRRGNAANHSAHSNGDFLPFNVRGYEMQRSELKHILDHLRGLTLNERIHSPGLSPERADIIVAGLAIIDVALKHLNVNTVRVHDQGLRAGLLHNMIDELLPHPAAPGATMNRMHSVRQFAEACHFEKEHSEHVTKLSLLMFDQLAGELGSEAKWATPENRELLHAAALLHDIGYFINYSRHHKHSYHLVMHSDLPGFTHHQREVIANVCRYHRGGSPKKAHPNFARLRKKDKDVVRTLSAVLRVADGLDRSHTSNVRGLEIHSMKGVAFVRLTTERDAAVDVWGAKRKSALFENVFDLKIRFSHADHAEDMAGPMRSEIGPPISANHQEPKSQSRLPRAIRRHAPTLVEAIAT